MEGQLGFNCHGKGRVRLVKVVRQADGFHDLIQLNIQILLEGDAVTTAFITGDNSNVVPTDTCKNTVYCLAKAHSFESIEEFGMIICRHFLIQHASVVNKITVDITKDNWQRIKAPDSKGNMTYHYHTFNRIGPKVTYTKAVGEKKGISSISYSILSGLRNLELMKTTQSGFAGFRKDSYTSLPELTDRLLGTSVTCEWDWTPPTTSSTKCSATTTEAVSSNIDYNQVSAEVEETIINCFAGPAETGVYSASVQQTLYDIGKSVLRVHPLIDKVVLYMPNIHNMVFPLDRYGHEVNDHTGQPDIFYPIDEPHGMIKAEITRSFSRSKL
mmetsp:Transcript_8387/g.8556  ORF Transcript_8387/g.8556 Transcript_8387/m.8556 type:complete len:328 (+) Transcript_8387:33-1016(+)